MKTKIKIILAAMFLIICSKGLWSQNTEAQLNQLELMKQFIGTWETEVVKDSVVLIVEIRPFGKAIEANVKMVSMGKTIGEGRWLWGYNREEDVFIAAEISDYSPGINLFAYSFISDNTVEKFAFADISNTERASLANKFEFKSPDLIVQTLTKNNKIISTFTIKRVKG